MSFVSLNIESPTDAPVKLTRRALAKQRTRRRRQLLRARAR